eukprot:XP_001698632.1 predicted protein [Chlamydomonas reinhardtii]
MPKLSVVAHELGGSGPLLLLLHANGFHGRIFLPMVPLLSKHFRCVALDLPGHGQAPAPTGPISEADLVAAVQDYVEREGVRGAFCMGHSLGGTLAALLEWERPGTFRRCTRTWRVAGCDPCSQSQGRPPAAPAGSRRWATWALWRTRRLWRQ